MKRIQIPFAVLAASIALVGSASAQTPNNVDQANIVTDFSADTLQNGTAISAWTPSVGTEAATVAAADVGVGGNYISDPTVSTNDSAFAGHKYVNFSSVPGKSTQGLATASDLGLTGAGNMSIASVYVTPDVPVIASPAGLANSNSTGTANAWMDLQSRTSGVNGDPYLAGFGNDLNSNVAAQNQVGQLTFALATYTVGAGSATFDLYWAFGLTGAVQHQSATIHMLNTTADQFELGFDAGDALSGATSSIEVGQAIAYNSALSSTDAAQEIKNLQAYYSAVPEPATYTLLGAALLGSLTIFRRRANA